MGNDLLRIKSEDVAGRIFDSIDTASHGAILPRQFERWSVNMIALEGWGSMSDDEQLRSIALVKALDGECANTLRGLRGSKAFNRPVQHNAVASNGSIARKDFIAFCIPFSDGLHHINAVMAADPEAILADPALATGRFTYGHSGLMSEYKCMEPFRGECGPLTEEFNASCCQPWKATFGDHDNPWLVTPEQDEVIHTLFMKCDERLRTIEKVAYDNEMRREIAYDLYNESQDSEGCKRFIEEQLRGFFEDLLQHEDLLGHPGIEDRYCSTVRLERINAAVNAVVKGFCDDLSPDSWPQLQPVVERLVHGSEEAIARCQARFEVWQDKLRKYDDAFRETFGYSPGLITYMLSPEYGHRFG